MAGNDFDSKVRDWMRGRRGADELSWTIVVVGLVLEVVGAVARVAWPTWVALACVAYALWRMLSKDVTARSAENAGFLRATVPVRKFLRNPKAAAQEAKTHKVVKCPKCGQKVRVPRGKGRIRVTCPKCREKFEIKS